MNIERDCLGESLHAALRKCCDSGATTAAYRAIKGLDAKTWSEYLNAANERLAESPEADVVKALQGASEDWAHRNRTHKNTFARSLSSAFAKFDQVDWGGFASFLVPYALEKIHRPVEGIQECRSCGAPLTKDKYGDSWADGDGCYGCPQ